MQSTMITALTEAIVTGLSGMKIEQGNVILYPGTIVGALLPTINTQLGLQNKRDARG